MAQGIVAHRWGRLVLGLAVTTVVVVCGRPAAADMIVNFTFDGNTRNAAFMATHVTAGAFSSSDGSVTFVAGNPSSGKAISDSGWKSGNYFEFTVTPEAGFALSLTSLTFDEYKAASLGTSWQVTYRVGNSGLFSTDGTGSLHELFGPTPMDTTDLSSISMLQNVSESVTLRLIAVGTSNDAKAWNVDNVTLNGQVVPEPASLAVLTAGAVGLAARWRRRGHRCR